MARTLDSSKKNPKVINNVHLQFTLYWICGGKASTPNCPLVEQRQPNIVYRLPLRVVVEL